MRRDTAVAGIESQHQATWKLAAHLPQPIRILQGLGPQARAGRCPGRAGGESPLRRECPPQLAGHIHGLANRPHAVEIGRGAIASAVEIDQVQAIGPQLDPMPSHGRRIVAKNGFAGVVSLPQTHALTTAQVNRRPNPHRGRIPRC